MIDTLILSGGGTNTISILGCMKYLFDNNHIKKLKNIVCVSGSMFLVILILLDFSVDFLIELFLTLDYNIIDKNDFKINNLLKDYGFYESDYIHNVLIEIFNKKNISENITLKELYEISNCRLIVKVSNLSKQSVEYIDHINTPDIPIIKLTKMTMSIPFIFKPIIYKDNFYVEKTQAQICSRLKKLITSHKDEIGTLHMTFDSGDTKVRIFSLAPDHFKAVISYAGWQKIEDSVVITKGKTISFVQELIKTIGEVRLNDELSFKIVRKLSLSVCLVDDETQWNMLQVSRSG